MTSDSSQKQTKSRELRAKGWRALVIAALYPVRFAAARDEARRSANATAQSIDQARSN